MTKTSGSVVSERRSDGPRVSGPRGVAAGNPSGSRPPGGPSARRPASIRRQVLPEPALDLPPPEPLVLRLADPVALVGEDHHAAGHVLPLQRGEERDALVVRNAVVQLPVQHERGGAELRGGE